MVSKKKKKKKKKKKERSSPKLRLIFRPISQIQTFEGGLFSYGGAIFNFSQKIGLKSIKNMRFCILHKPMGGLDPPPPPPGYATVYSFPAWRSEIKRQCEDSNMCGGCVIGRWLDSKTGRFFRCFLAKATWWIKYNFNYWEGSFDCESWIQ